ANTLERLDDLELGPGQINVLPMETEQLPAPQAEEDRQDIDRVQPLPVRGAEHSPGMLDCQAAVDLVPGSGYLDELGHVTGNDLLTRGRLQRVSQYCVDRLNHSCGQRRLAARAAGLGAAPRFFALLIPAVLAALAFLTCPGNEGPDVLRSQLGESP